MDTKIKHKIELRPKCNFILMNVMQLALHTYKDLRFLQLFYSMNIIDEDDRFFEEPYDTIVRILPTITDLLDINSDISSDINKAIKYNITLGLSELKLI